MTENVLVIRDSNDLIKLQTGDFPSRIKLEVSGKSKKDLTMRQESLARSLSTCGCDTAAIFLIIGFLPASLPFWIPSLAGLDKFERWGAALGVLIVFVLAGKAVGTIRARRRVYQELKIISKWMEK